MILLFCTIAAFILIIVYSLTENRYIKTVEYILHCDKKNRIRVVTKSECAEQMVPGVYTHIVQLSDLHNCRYGEKNRRLVEKVKACQPDVILITGDMINKYKPVSDELYDLFEQLGKLCICIYSLGNHELKEREKYPDRFSEYLHKVQSCGIIISDNERHRVTINNTVFQFASYSSDLQQYKKNSKQSTDYNAKEIPTADADGVTVLLSHNPELTRQYVKTTYSIIFSGHLHGGIVRVPGWRGIISTRFVLFPKYDGGCYYLDESHVLVVSRGLGSHTIKFRLFNRPELVHTVVVAEQ